MSEQEVKIGISVELYDDTEGYLIDTLQDASKGVLGAALALDAEEGDDGPDSLTFTLRTMLTGENMVTLATGLKATLSAVEDMMAREGIESVHDRISSVTLKRQERRGD